MPATPRPRVVEAIRAQAAELDFAPSFQWGHPKAFLLASQLAHLFPGDLDHAFFTNSGSESVDTALKIALAYQRAIGQGTRTRLIGRERGYHGVGFGGISVGGMVKNRMYFGSLLTGVDHLPHTLDLETQPLQPRPARARRRTRRCAREARRPPRRIDDRRRDRRARCRLDRRLSRPQWGIWRSCARSPRSMASC